MAFLEKGVSEESFYGPRSFAQREIETIINSSPKSYHTNLPCFMNELLGPSRTWKVFKKQSEALTFCANRRNGLKPFAFEELDGHRSFLVAHPKVFWALNSHRFFKDCSTYEIIQEHKICKLYLDVEFEYAYNSKTLDGCNMLKNFLTILNHNLHSLHNIVCAENDILDLDSSNDKKFSHHIIYQLPRTAFRDNYAVGNFLSGICHELKSAFEGYVCGSKDGVVTVAKKYSVTEENVLEFFVKDSKGKDKLFIDEGVYTKNRHFRLFGSTKLGKNSPLVVSRYNRYVPNSNDSSNCSLFLDSLITYFSSDIVNILDCKFPLEKFRVKKQPALRNSNNDDNSNASNNNLMEMVLADYSPIDNFIARLISPMGRIRKKSTLMVHSKIIYDIYGYRYCDNIKRHHRSNNVIFVVDLEKLEFYQKCYDPDCSNFKSQPRKLPEEICFLFEDDSIFLNFNLNIDKMQEETVGNGNNLNVVSD